eukprot:SAG31_NODE_3299_length_4445_cov_3.190520_4_plen_392_part_00
MQAKFAERKRQERAKKAESLRAKHARHDAAVHDLIRARDVHLDNANWRERVKRGRQRLHAQKLAPQAAERRRADRTRLDERTRANRETLQKLGAAKQKPSRAAQLSISQSLGDENNRTFDAVLHGKNGSELEQSLYHSSTEHLEQARRMQRYRRRLAEKGKVQMHKAEQGGEDQVMRPVTAEFGRITPIGRHRASSELQLREHKILNPGDISGLPGSGAAPKFLPEKQTIQTTDVSGTVTSGTTNSCFPTEAADAESDHTSIVSRHDCDPSCGSPVKKKGKLSTVPYLPGRPGLIPWEVAPRLMAAEAKQQRRGGAGPVLMRQQFHFQTPWTLVPNSELIANKAVEEEISRRKAELVAAEMAAARLAAESAAQEEADARLWFAAEAAPVQK